MKTKPEVITTDMINNTLDSINKMLVLPKQKHVVRRNDGSEVHIMRHHIKMIKLDERGKLKRFRDILKNNQDTPDKMDPKIFHHVEKFITELMRDIFRCHEELNKPKLPEKPSKFVISEYLKRKHEK